jgi:hypothetical protein
MATLLELRSRLERTMGLYGAVPNTDVDAHMLDALNDALKGLARRRKWYWWLEEDASTLAGLSAGATSSTLPSDCTRIECILNPDEEVVAPKTPHRQLHYPDAIGDSTTDQTYAMGGISSATRLKTILWDPPLLDGGDYVLWYYRVPAALSDDTDEPDLPDEFHDYLYWRALHMLLLSDEERGHLLDRVKAEAIEVYRDMETAHARNIETLTRRIYAVP